MGRHALTSVHVPPAPEFPQVTMLSLTPADEPSPPRLRRTFWRTAFKCARRHLPPELIGTALALLAGLAAHHGTGSLAATAVAGTVGGCAGYYGALAAADARQELRRPGRDPAQRAIRRARLSVARLGPAEMCDLLVVRPGLFYLVPTMTSAPLVVGLLTAKLVADVVYVVVLSRTLVEPTLVWPSGAPR